MGIDIKRIQGCNLNPFWERLRANYNAMDHLYADAAAYYGFDCAGCMDNCCQTHFYHYTYLEFFYILEGLKTLSVPRAIEMQSRAFAMCRELTAADTHARPLRHMCPLNVDTLCILYAYRPMICRLHGIAHEWQTPAGSCLSGPGCATFDRRCAERSYFTFDRTPFYREMAALENAFRQKFDLSAKLKMTIAEMLVHNERD